MPIFRVEHNKFYTCISNAAIRDGRLSYGARGLHHLLLSNSDEWDISVRNLAAISKEGRIAIANFIKELEEFGYLTREQSRAKGTFSKTVYNVRELPKNTKVEFIDDSPVITFPDHGTVVRFTDVGDTACGQTVIGESSHIEITKERNNSKKEITNTPPTPQGEIEGDEPKQCSLDIPLPESTVEATTSEQEKPPKPPKRQKKKYPRLSSDDIKNFADVYSEILESQQLQRVWHGWKSEATSESRLNLLQRFCDQCMKREYEPLEVWRTALLYGIKEVVWVKKPRKGNKHSPDTFIRTTSDWAINWYSAVLSTSWQPRSPAQKVAESYSRLPKAMQAIYAKELQDLRNQGVQVSEHY